MKDHYTITVKDIYGTDNPKIPDGYEMIDFRPYKQHEEILGVPCTIVLKAYHDGQLRAPFIILRKKKVMRKEVTLTETGEFRIPRSGEWIIDKWNEVVHFQGLTGTSYKILKYEEREIEE
jgi:hypothetical protein